MRQLLGELFITRLDLALEVVLPILIVGFILGVVAYGFIYLGRRIERFEWRRELAAGNRMGQVVKEKIGKRDARIRHLTKLIAKDEARLDWSDKQQREMAVLSSEMLALMLARNQEEAGRRRA